MKGGFKLNKNDYIRFNINSDIKNNFVRACDGRPMTIVLVNLIEQYIERKNNESKFELNYKKIYGEKS